MDKQNIHYYEHLSELFPTIIWSYLSTMDKTALAILIYYPQKKISLIKQTETDMDNWYKTTLYRLIEVCKIVSSKYTRSKLREHPYELTEDEMEVMMRLKSSFRHCEKLQKHVEFLLKHGSLYKI